MRLLPFRALVLVFILLGLAPGPPVTAAHPATPVVGDDYLETGFTCSEEAREAGRASVGEQPANGALVSPASAPAQDLYLLEVTVPAGACVWFDDHFLHDGAMVWYLQSGSVELALDLLEGWPPPDLTLVRAGGTVEPVSPTISLATGDWLSADRAVGYAYRNDGEEPAVILMTVLESRWVYTGEEFNPLTAGTFDCRGSCRNSRR